MKCSTTWGFAFGMSNSVVIHKPPLTPTYVSRRLQFTEKHLHIFCSAVLNLVYAIRVGKTAAFFFLELRQKT